MRDVQSHQLGAGRSRPFASKVISLRQPNVAIQIYVENSLLNCYCPPS